MQLISPGVCIDFELRSEFEKPLCGQSKGIGKPAPPWFAAAVQRVLGKPRCGRPADQRSRHHRG